ncbi:hypothetical protein C8J57DRAFT_1479982 [Mycena rebaudengoi]|nr:hypothetical protein C8J57DRAFT_1479982 [Mycena rebaudengoi]
MNPSAPNRPCVVCAVPLVYGAVAARRSSTARLNIYEMTGLATAAVLPPERSTHRLRVQHDHDAPPAEPEYISVSAIIFLADEERPRIINISCRLPQRRSQGLCPLPILQPYFDAQPESVVLTQGLNGELLRFPLHVFYSPTALARCSPINRSIYHITSGAVSKPWCGNVVALNFNGSRRQGYTDAGSNDLPLVGLFPHLSVTIDISAIATKLLRNPHSFQ